MSTFEIKGKVFKVLESQTGTGKKGQWIKGQFIIETCDQYPKKILFAAWGDLATTTEKLKIGSMINVCFNVESREHNDKWYSELKAYKFNPLEEKETKAAPAAVEVSQEQDDDLPF